MGSRISRYVAHVHTKATALSTPATTHQKNDEQGAAGDQQTLETVLTASESPNDQSVATASPDFAIIQSAHEASVQSRQGSLADTTTMATTGPEVSRHMPEPEAECTVSLPPVLGNEETITASASPSLPPPTTDPAIPTVPVEPETHCIACATLLPKPSNPQSFIDVLRPCVPCHSAYCKTCLGKIFTRASNDMESMPPRCCEPLPLYYAKHVLDAEELTTFRAKYEEWATPKPTYCPIPTCSVFIPRRMIPQIQTRKKRRGKRNRVDSGVGTPKSESFACPSCTIAICADCHQSSHPLTPCRTTPVGLDPATAELLKAWGYKACPKCGHGIKRMFGCNHMACRCGSHFCWSCLQSRDVCDGGCAYDSEDGTEYDSDGEFLGPDREEDDIGEPATAVDEESAPVRDEGDTTPTLDPAEPTEPGTVSTAPASVPAPTAEPLAPGRPRNLDGGTGRYWESSDFYFGEEPTNEDMVHSWGCEHDFRPAVTSPADAWSVAGGLWDCMRCWKEVQPRIRRKTTGHTVMVVGVSGVRERRRGRACELVRGNATVGLGRVSSSVPAAAAPLMSEETGEEKIERLVDTYGIVINTTGLSERRRASFSGPLREEISGSVGVASWAQRTTNQPVVFSAQVDADPLFSPAHSCHWCSLVVCGSCKDLLLESNSEDDSDGSEDDETGAPGDGGSRQEDVVVAASVVAGPMP